MQIGTVSNYDIWAPYLTWNLYNSAVKISLKAWVNELKYVRYEKFSIGPWELHQVHTLKKGK